MRKRLADGIDFSRMSTDPADEPIHEACEDVALGLHDGSRRKGRHGRQK